MASTIDQLLQVLAKKLPAGASRSTTQLAFRSAVDGLPQSKTRDKLLLRQNSYIRQLLGLVQAKQKQEPDESTGGPVEAESKRSDEEDDVDGSEAEGPTDGASSSYQGVDSSEPIACLGRFETLLTAALAGLNPRESGREAVEGLLAVLPPEGSDSWQTDVKGIDMLARLLPNAAAAMEVLGCEDPPPAWRRFLGLAACLLQCAEVQPANEGDALEAARRLGGTLALLACPAAARSALRISLSALGSDVSGTLLARLVPAVLPLVRVAFSRGKAASAPETTRGDLLALLCALRFLKLASKEVLCSSSNTECLEARKVVISSLRRDFDATPLLPDLRRLLEDNGSAQRGKALRKKVASCMASPRSPAAAAALTVEVLEALDQRLLQQPLRRLASCSGLAAGPDETIDQKAAAARASGALFFEDVGGGDAEPVSSAATEAGDHARKRSLGSLEGVENLRKPGVVKSNGSKRKKAKATKEDPGQGDAKGEVKRARRRRK